MISQGSLSQEISTRMLLQVKRTSIIWCLRVKMLRAYFIMALLISALAVSMRFVTVQAESSIPKPSVPDFTVRLIDSSYYNIIEVKIKNQPVTTYFDGSVTKTTQIFYSIRVKGHFSQDWAVIEQWDKEISDSDPYVFNPYPEQDYSSDYTVLTFHENIPSNDELDFQAPALIGQVERVGDPNHSIIYNMLYAEAVFTGETSDWSKTQTLTLSASPSPPSSPSPTTTSDQTPATSPTPTPQENS
jgi:hypothetical protein